MALPALIDQWGRPLAPASVARLSQEIAVPTVTGVRQLFEEFVASGLTPHRLGRILRDAATGDMHEFLTLAEEMEERETQYASVLGTRKRAISGIVPQIVSPTEDALDEEIADAVRDDILAHAGFPDLVDDMLDALGKGYSVAEIVWRTDGPRWVPERYVHKDPRIFRFERERREELRLRVMGEPEGVPLEPCKYIVHIPKLKSGLPARNGLARLACWTFLLKSFSLKDWAAFLEVHGMPLRLGKYGPGAGPAEKAVLLRAVRDLGADAAAIIPTSMEIELVETKGFSEKPFEGFASYLDKALSKAITGQTMSADEGASGGLAQAKVHENVRIDIKKADARQLAVPFNRDLIRPYVDFNFGPQKRYPTAVWPVVESEDLKTLAEALESLIDRGLEIEMAEVRDRFGFREPEPKAKLMVPAAGKAATTAPEPKTPEPEPAKAANWRLDPRACPGCGSVDRTPNAAIVGDDERDRVAAEGAGEWERVVDPLLSAVQVAAAACNSFDEFSTALDRLAADLPVDALGRSLAVTGMKGRGLGDLGEGT